MTVAPVIALSHGGGEINFIQCLVVMYITDMKVHRSPPYPW